MKFITSYFGCEIPDNGQLWWHYVKQGVLPAPDSPPDFYRDETISALAARAGHFNMSSQSQFGEWCRQEIAKRHPPVSQSQLFQNTLAALKKAKQLDQERADAEFNKRVEAHIPKMKQPGRL